MGECPGLSPEEYWCGEAHHIDEIAYDIPKNLRLYQPGGKKGFWVIDSTYKPQDEDYLMKRHLRLRKIK